MKYSSLTFQMMAAIGLATWLGVYLDEQYQKSPLFTAIFSLLGVIIGIYLGIKEFLQNK
ncbi:MAG: AtpZ/AtpI family protein [Cytophagales bacterium]|nr:AtpZ/AtpI family protein [Cytophagales bacterium]